MEKLKIEETMPEERRHENRKRLTWLHKNKMLVTTLLGVLVGLVLGFTLRPLNLKSDVILLIGYPGELFIRLLKLNILPLIFTSLITGTSSHNGKMNGQIAVKTFIFFFSTSLFSSILGTVLVLLIRPGEIERQQNNYEEMGGVMNHSTGLLDSILDLGRNLIPDNLFQATFESTYTVYVENTDPFGANKDQDFVKGLKYRPGTNTLGIVFFCVLFGTTLAHIGERGRIVSEMVQTIFEVIIRMVTRIMWLTPLGVASITANKILSVANIEQVLSQLAWLIGTVCLGLVIFQFIVLQLIYFVIVRKNPFKFYYMLLHPMLTAAACGSTAAALPITFQVMETEIKIDPRVTRFVLPIGCGVNTDGTAIMISVSSIFIAQMYNVPLGPGQIILICFLSFTSSISISPVPSATLIMLIMVLTTIGLPSQDVALLFAIDWLMDRLRTSTNMLSDCYAAAVVEHLSKDTIRAMDMEGS